MSLSNINTSRWVLIVLSVWCVTACVLGALGAITYLRPPFPQVVLVSLIALLFIAFRSFTAFRSWLITIPIEWLIAVHIVRFVGLYFLWLHEHGRLPFAFAVPGGWGDISIATLAMLLLIFGRLTSIAHWVYWIWNIFGLIDILFVVATAARLALADAKSMSELLDLPLSLLPTFMIPIVIFSHGVIIYRLRVEYRQFISTS